jgi:hypothetical protein
MSAREEWLSELVYGAVPVFGRVAVKLNWSADHRRDVLKGFINQAGSAGRVSLPDLQRFFAAPRAKELDDALFPTASPNTSERKPSTTAAEATEAEMDDPGQAKRARIRQAVVMPILDKKHWKRGRWASEAGVGKNSVYEYLDGKRSLTPENRKAMAEAIDLKAEDLPE